MSINTEFFIVTPFVLAFFTIAIYKTFKKRKRSAKSIYKLIDDLEKKYIY